MSERGDIEFLGDIKEGIVRITTYLGQKSYEEFLKDTKTQDAIVRNLEIIGEAAKNISQKIKRKYPQIQWKKLAGARDRLIHQYFGVNYDIIWAIANDELKDVLSQIENILDNEGGK